MWTDSFRSFFLSRCKHTLELPSQIVVAEHAAFRIARRSTSVDQAAALSWLLLGDLTQDKIIAKSLSKLQKVFP